jgi:hypothetical protein
MTDNLHKQIQIGWLLLLVSMQIAVAQELYTVTSLPFNSREYNDFAAVPYKDGVVFCSNRIQSAILFRTDSSGQPLSDLYFAKKLKDGKWEKKPEIFSKELNSKYHEGPMSFSSDGNEIYFTIGESTEGIFSSVFNGSQWGPIKTFPYNETTSKSTQPCISPDGNTLYFSSNRPGGNGKYDIYVCTKKNNQWSKPRNIGPPINSAYSEGYPFFRNGKLYFSSNRPGGAGGFDIYFSREVNGKWAEPILLPSPINSAKDDFAYWSDNEDRHGFLSSDRSNRQRALDIYEFTFNFPLLDSAKIQETNSYSYLISDPSSTVKDTTTFKYEWEFGDGSKHLGKELELAHTYATTGDYTVVLNVIDTLTHDVQKNKWSFVIEARDIEQPFITCLDTAYTGKEISFDALKTNLPNFPIANYYWDFGDDHVATGKEVKHIFKDPGVYKIILGITSTPDANNQTKTEARFRYLVIKNSTSQ